MISILYFENLHVRTHTHQIERERESTGAFIKTTIVTPESLHWHAVICLCLINARILSKMFIIKWLMDRLCNALLSDFSDRWKTILQCKCYAWARSDSNGKCIFHMINTLHSHTQTQLINYATNQSIAKWFHPWEMTCDKMVLFVIQTRKKGKEHKMCSMQNELLNVRKSAHDWARIVLHTFSHSHAHTHVKIPSIQLRIKLCSKHIICHSIVARCHCHYRCGGCLSSYDTAQHFIYTFY